MKAPAGGRYNGLEVYVQTSDGIRLNEYDSPSDLGLGEESAGKIQTCFLECHEDSSTAFEIISAIDGGSTLSTDISVRYFVDGRKLLSRGMRKGRSGICRRDCMYERTASHVLEHKLFFAELRLAEDSDIEFGASLKELGEIRVVIVAGVHGKSNVEHHRHTMPTVGEVDERRKKWAPWSNQYEFVFKYLSKQMLMARRIIEPPSPPPEPSRSPAALDEDEENEGGTQHGPSLNDQNASRLQELQAEIARIKAETRGERVKEDIKPDIRVDREMSASRRKRLRGDGTETSPVDLSFE